MFLSGTGQKISENPDAEGKYHTEVKRARLPHHQTAPDASGYYTGGGLLRCKEIYYKAFRLDDKIGTATVYRMVNTLEEIGAISRKNMYRITCDQGCEMENACTIEFDDNTIVELSSSKWNQIIQSGLLACGYLNGHHVRSIMAKSYE